MHHDVGDFRVRDGVRVEGMGVAGGIGGFAAKEDAGIRVHGGLVEWDRLVELPHDNGFRVVKEVLANAGKIFHDGNGERRELR